MDKQGEPLAELQQFYQEHKLPAPYIPAEMRPLMTRVASGVFGTRTGIHNLADTQKYYEEAGTQPVADYLLLGLPLPGRPSGHLCYYLVRGPLLLFTRLYYKADTRNDAIEKTYSSVEALINAAEKALRSGRYKPGERLIVVYGELHSQHVSRWIYLPAALDRKELRDATRWHNGKDAITAALEAVERKA